MKEKVRGLKPIYYCPIDEKQPIAQKGEIAVIRWHPACLKAKLEEEQTRLAIMEEVYNSPMQVQNRKLKKTEEALMEITRAIAGNTK